MQLESSARIVVVAGGVVLVVVGVNKDDASSSPYYHYCGVYIAKNKLKPLKNRALTSHTSRGLASIRNERQVEEETQKLLSGVVVIVGVEDGDENLYN